MTRDLTQALAPFSEAFASLVGPWMHRLDRLVGPLRPVWRPELEGAPDGFSGVAHRGPPERLLASEWLLAEEVPDLFLLRAAEGTQLHTATRRTADAPERDVVLVFDTGPDQAGAPRLVHVALALVVAWRLNAEVWWGSLNKPDAVFPIDPANPSTLNAVLKARSAARADPRGWMDTARNVDVVWVGQPAAGLPGLRVDIREDLADAVIRVSAGSRQIALPLPPPDQVARVFKLGLQNRAAAGLRVRAGVGGKPVALAWTGQRALSAHGPSRIRTYSAEVGEQVVGMAARGAVTARVFATPTDLRIEVLDPTRKHRRYSLGAGPIRMARGPLVLPVRELILLPHGVLLLQGGNGAVTALDLAAGSRRELRGPGPAPLIHAPGGWFGWRTPSGIDRLTEQLRPCSPLGTAPGRTLVRMFTDEPDDWSNGTPGFPSLTLPEGHVPLAAVGHRWRQQSLRLLVWKPESGEVLFDGAPVTDTRLFHVWHEPARSRFVGIDDDGAVHMVDWRKATLGHGESATTWSVLPWGEE